MIKAISSPKLAAAQAVFPELWEWIREGLWDALQATEKVDPEQVIYTFSFRARVWKLSVPVSFTFRIKHLRFVLGAVIGDPPKTH